MIVYKNKRRKKYFNRGAKQKYVKIFNAVHKSQKPVATGLPAFNSYLILTLMAGAFIFFTATFALQHAPVLPKINFEFSLPGINTDNITKSVSNTVKQFKIPSIQQAPKSAPREVSEPKKQIELPKIQLPRFDIGGKIATFFDTIANSLSNLARTLNPLPFIKSVFTYTMRFLSTVTRAIGTFFVIIISAIGSLITAIMSGVGNFLQALLAGIGRILSPLDPRPAIAVIAKYLKLIFSPVATTTQESSFLVDIFGNSLKQTLSDIGKGFGTITSVFKFMQS